MAVPKPLVRAGQVALTFVVFALFNKLGETFVIGNGVSILYPAAAVSVLGFMMFGPWAALGIILGTLITPWHSNADFEGLLLSGLVGSLQGFIPWLVFRVRRDLSRDLRDMKSLGAFLFFGVVLNSAVCAIAGNLLVVTHAPGVRLVWREVFVWFISDFAAVLLIATPILAFGGTLLDRTTPGRPRTIANALEIVSVILLLGFAASFVIRTVLLLDPIIEPMARRKILIVTSMVDGVVFLMLVFAAVTLLYTMSRPFVQLGEALQRMRSGARPDASSIDDRYEEFRSLAETLEETADELRRREEELRLQTERAVRASRHKSDFLAKMSHELRTPLNAIIGFSDLLTEQEETITPAKRLGFLENVANSARHLLKLINDLLDIAKVESGKLKLELLQVDLRRSIANTVASTQSLFVRKKQEVEVLTPETPMTAMADAGRIEQVLLNLLSNANKFSPEGTSITVHGYACDSMWCIEVIDRGIGISESDQQRIFEEFEQVHTRGVHSAGTGLGLALAKRFVEAHAGELSVESTLGAGSTFRVKLPRQ
ncbi:MAG TPA: ATP-binding protein [Thermoanaerobaculia bacterium]|nr:ATP-binding protein [Thermoanaerobaculia bacterium]